MSKSCGRGFGAFGSFGTHITYGITLTVIVFVSPIPMSSISPGGTSNSLCGIIAGCWNDAPTSTPSPVCVL